MIDKHTIEYSNNNYVNQLQPILMRLGLWDTPTTFDNSLSWYQALKYVLQFLIEQIIPPMQDNDTKMNELIDYYGEVVDYCNNYFDNLDVQEEINNKLNDMAQDGSLLTVVTPYLQFEEESRINADNIEKNERIEADNIEKNSRISADNNLQSQIRALASGAPLIASSTDEMTDTTRVYVNTTDGHWYTYNGTTWVDGGVYQATEDSDTLETLQKTVAQIGSLSPNIFDKNSEYLILNKLRKGNQGDTIYIDENTTYNGFASIIIPIDKTGDYIFSSNNYAFYQLDEDFKILAKDNNASVNEITPFSKTISNSNVKYVCIQWKYTSVSIDNYMAVQGTDLPLQYVPFGLLLNPNFEIPENNFAYVSNSGNDENDGSINSPFKTIKKAIESKAKTIVIEEGIYNENIEISNRNELNIFTKWKDTYNYWQNYKRPKVILDCSTEFIPTFDSVTNLYKTPYVADENEFIYKVFITHSLPVRETSSNRSIGYNATLWEIADNEIEDFKLIPVLTLQECQNASGTWFYDGNYIYINKHDSDNTSYKLADKFINGINLSYINKLQIDNIETKYSRENGINIRYCNILNIENCITTHSSINNGFSLDYVNGIITKCEALKNRNDGFNMHGFGNTDFFECKGYYNGDDGISHHDGCTGSIHGGEYHHNGKGGISSPTHGADVTIYNSLSHDNYYGIYIDSNNNEHYQDKIAIINGGLINNNTVGLYASRYKVKTINSIIQNNTTNTREENNGEIENYS